MADYETVIGLEVHCQLNTNSKLFCSCPANAGGGANEAVCEICAAMPGTLPALNEQAVANAAKLGLAINAKINLRSVFARKNYFYPDLPKAYQISQYDPPICEGGHLDINVDGAARRIRINRIHMEEDAGKTIHSAATNQSFVDLNRGGVPLLEIVSEPDLRSSDQAVAYLKALRDIVGKELADFVEQGVSGLPGAPMPTLLSWSVRQSGCTRLGLSGTSRVAVAVARRKAA